MNFIYNTASSVQGSNRNSLKVVRGIVYPFQSIFRCNNDLSSDCDMHHETIQKSPWGSCLFCDVMHRHLVHRAVRITANIDEINLCNKAYNYSPDQIV